MAAVERLISRMELSRRVTLSKTRTYAQCEEGGTLHSAMVDGRVDLEHPAAYAFCKEHGYKEPDAKDIARAAVAKHKQQQTPVYAPAAELILPEIDESLDDSDEKTAEQIMGMTLAEVIARYGKMAQFKEWVSVNKNLVQTRGLEEEQARKRGEYMHWSHADKLVAHVDALQSALLSETTVNIASTVTALVKAKAEKKQIERSVHDVISRTIKATKQRIVRELRQ